MAPAPPAGAKAAQRIYHQILERRSRVLRWLEVLLRPRLGFLHDQVLFRRVSGAFIMVSGLLLLLPVPVPFTNTLPALTVILLAAGAMERDGVFFLAGCGLFALTASYFGPAGVRWGARAGQRAPAVFGG